MRVADVKVSEGDTSVMTLRILLMMLQNGLNLTLVPRIPTSCIFHSFLLLWFVRRGSNHVLWSDPFLELFLIEYSQ